MIKKCWLFSFSVAVWTTFLVQGVKADPYYDAMVFTNNYESAGCSGTYTGMYCRKNGGARQATPFEKALWEKLNRERETTKAATRDALAAFASLLDRPEELLEPFGTLPRPPKFREDQSKYVVCLRANLTSLFLLQEHPEVFARLAAEKTGGVEGLEIYINGYAYAEYHTLGMYFNAAQLIGGNTDLQDVEFANNMQNLIQSQLVSSLVQLGYFTDRYDLLTGSGSELVNQDVIETVLSVGFRVGFFSEVNEKLDYPFARYSCLQDLLGFQHAQKIREVVAELAFSNFSLEDVLPAVMYARISRGPEIGSFDWLMDNEHNLGTYVDWLGARVLAITDIQGSVPDFERHKDGVMIVYIEENSLAQRVGLQKGHVIWNIRPIAPKWLTQRPGIVISSAQDMIKAIKQDYPVHGFEFIARRPRTPGVLTIDAKFN